MAYPRVGGEDGREREDWANPRGCEESPWNWHGSRPIIVVLPCWAEERSIILRIQLADVLAVAGGTALLLVGDGWLKVVGAAVVAVYGVIVVRRSLRAGEWHRWAAEDRTEGR